MTTNDDGDDQDDTIYKCSARSPFPGQSSSVRDRDRFCSGSLGTSASGRDTVCACVRACV